MCILVITCNFDPFLFYITKTDSIGYLEMNSWSVLYKKWHNTTEKSLFEIRPVNYCRFTVKSCNLQDICAAWYFVLHAENITLHPQRSVITLDLTGKSKADS